jgi:hypothetical protein
MRCISLAREETEGTTRLHARFHFPKDSAERGRQQALCQSLLACGNPLVDTAQFCPGRWLKRIKFRAFLSGHSLNR